jgi:electron transport complex protein RnfB
MIIKFTFLCAAFALAALAYPALRERMADATPPSALRGVPIWLITAAILAFALSASVEPGAIESLAILGAVMAGFATSAALGKRYKPKPTVEQIDQLLPQTQCGQCGYAGCKPYAAAIAGGEADINQCPPGGLAGVQALARLLGREAKPLNPANGIEKPKAVALIREPECIGCTKCIQACPVDAIVGASKSMHVVIADLCTGCELCIPPCPVDCIDLIPIS